MFHLSTLSLIYFLLLSTLIHSSPQHRYQRNASTEFPQYGDFDLVLQNGDDFLEFKICCTKSFRCDSGSFLFCFETKEQQQGSNLLYGCGDGTCAYNIEFMENNKYSLLGSIFSATDKCFNGKITKEKDVVFYSNDKEENAKGCPLDIKSGNRLKLDVRSIPHGVTVTAMNAYKYSEPTSTSAPKNDTSETFTEEAGMSDGLKFGLIAGGLIVIFLIIGGVIFGIYKWKKCKKTAKPAPTITVIQPGKENETTQAKPKPSEVNKKDADNVKDKLKVETQPKITPPNVKLSIEPSKEPTIKPSAEPLPQQPSKEPSVFPSSEHVKLVAPSELPKATPTIAELVTKAARNRRHGKLGDTFDKIKKPDFENVFDSMIRQNWISEDAALKLKEKYPRPPSPDEILLFSLPIGDMIVKLEQMIDAAIKRHKNHSEDAQCRLIYNPNVTYFVSYFAIVLHFAKFFKVQKSDKLYKYSVPLLLGIAMDRNQDIPIRRRALVEMVQKAIRLTHVFNEGQCLKLPYPMNILCLSFQLDDYLPKNVDKLRTFSSPNNSECTKSGGSNGNGGNSGATEGGKKESSSSKASKTSVSKEVVEMKKAKRKH